MTGRRGTRRSARPRELGPREAGPAVRDELPPIMSRTSTAYGSPFSATIRQDRRGQVRNLEDMVEQVLQEKDQPNTDSEEDEEREPPPDPEPEEELELQQSSRPPTSRGPLGSGLGALGDDEADVQTGLRGGKSKNPSPGQREGSEAPARKSPRHTGRAGSAPPVPTPMDTSRSFGTESGIFGSARIPSTPGTYQSSRFRRPTAIEEESESDEELPRTPESDSRSDQEKVSDTDQRGLPRRLSPFARLRRNNGPPGRRQREGRSLPSGSDDEEDGSSLARTENQRLEDAQGVKNQPSLLSIKRQKQREVEEQQRIQSAAAHLTRSAKIFASMRSEKAPRPTEPIRPSEIPRQSDNNRQTKSIFEGIKPANTEQEIEFLRRRQRERSIWHQIKRPFTGWTKAPDNQTQPSRTERTRRRVNAERSTARQNHVAQQDSAIRVQFNKIVGFSEWIWGHFTTALLSTVKNVGSALLILSLLMLAVSLLRLDSSTSSDSNIHWYGWSGLSDNIGQFIPHGLLHPFGTLSGDDATHLHKLMRDYGYEIKSLKDANNLHDSSLQALRKFLPKIVKLELDKRGRPVISQEFWHALKDIMKDDGVVLMFDEKSGEYRIASDRHWLAIKKKIEDDGIIESTVSASWERWLQKNKQSVDQGYGKNYSQNETFVTRSEFIRHLKSEFITHRNDIKAEFDAQRDDIETQINAVLRLKEDRSLTEAQVRDIIKNVIAKEGLRAMAKGKIHANWDEELKHQVNFFSRGTGAVIDPRFNSPSYEPPNLGSLETPFWLKAFHKGLEPIPPIAALMRWEDVGECWCGAITQDRSGASQGTSLSIKMGHRVIPQHIVVEHILPGATLDREARPKNIEVHAYIEELNLRNRVADFSAAHFPEQDGTANVAPLNLDGFVKIGQFAYETSDVHDGVHVHRLSSELLAVGAATDQVILRAVTTYGATDHTCFYRVRLYGELKEE